MPEAFGIDGTISRVPFFPHYFIAGHGIESFVNLVSGHGFHHHQVSLERKLRHLLLVKRTNAFRRTQNPNQVD